MKIIEPSAMIVDDEFNNLSTYQRIDKAASICYQRPPKPTEEEAILFCVSMLTRRHFATLEFATVHLCIDCETVEDQLRGEKYIQVSKLSGFRSVFIVSGSIRAFIESKNVGIMNYIKQYLSLEYHYFFTEHIGNTYDFIRFAKPEEIPDDHKHIMVRLICDRTVSHQIVRHRPCSFLQESQRFCRYEDEVVFIRPAWYSLSDERFCQASKHWEDHCTESERLYKHLLKSLSPQQARLVLPNSTKTEVLVYTNVPEWKHILALRDSNKADPEMKKVMYPLHREFNSKFPEIIF